MEPELVDRADELRELEGVLSRDPPGVAVVSGHAGVGKSHLVRHLGRIAEDRGWRVEMALATEAAASIPFGALAHVLPPPGPSPDQQLSYLQRALDHITSLRDDGRTLLAVDDAHHLDPASATFLHQLTLARPIAVVLTRRTGERCPDAVDEIDKAADARVRLDPLSSSATSRFVEALLGGPASESLRVAAFQVTEGNPLYLRELLYDARDEGRIEHRDDLWVLVGTLAPGDRLRELVAGRMVRLSDDERRVLELLALGEPLETDLLLEHSDSAVVDGLIRQGFVVTHRSENRRTASLSHPVYREALRVEIPEPRAREICGALADALEARGLRRSGDVLRLATWQLETGHPTDGGTLVAAARWSLAVFDHGLAERLARAAGGHGSFESSLVLAEALSYQLRHDEADAAFEAAGTHAVAGQERLLLAVAHAQHLFFRARRPSQATELLHEALAEHHGSPDREDQIRATLAMFAAVQGDLPTASDAGDRILDRDAPAPAVLVGTLFVSTLADAMLGRFQRAHDGVETGLRHVDDVRQHLPLADDILRVNDVAAHAFAGDLHRAEALARSGRREALEANALDTVGPWSWLLLEVLLLRGRIEDARRIAAGTFPIVDARDPLLVGPSLVPVSVVIDAHAGEDAPPPVVARYESLPFDADARLTTLAARARGWRSLLHEDAATAAERALEAGATGEEQTQLVWAAFGYHDAVRFGHPEGSVGPLTDLAARMEGDLVPTLADHATAARDGDPDGLDEVSRRFEVLGADLLAAESAAQAARLHATDRPHRARRATSRARAMAARCPGARTPALRGLGGEELTARELQVSRLASEGLSSQEIAERLTLSRRTVDNYLGSAYRKLGINGRQELAYALGVQHGRA